jgi:hypothetical protein
MNFEFSSEEQNLNDEIRSVYNSGHCDKAFEMSREFLRKFPNSLLAKYSYSIMAGDFAYDLRHSEEEKTKLLDIAKTGTSELFKDSDLNKYPLKFQKGVKNEYFWFHEMPEEQYQLGIDWLKIDPRGGHYSACVGASMVALKQVRLKNIKISQQWAEKSYYHFQEFEKIAPDWYNINYFGAQSLACLGKYQEAVVIYKDMFRKQGNKVNEDELSQFQKVVDEILKARV